MTKLIEVKEGNKTRYLTPEAYKRYLETKDEIKTNVGDITCSGASSVGMGFKAEDYERIFGKKDKNID